VERHRGRAGPRGPLTDAKSAAFESAFVAVSYLLGRRADLTGGLEAAGEAAHRVAAALLATKERGERARLLSAELAPLATSLAARSVS
jgi:hypothetical protein